MTRHEARELAFILLFETMFTDDTVEEIAAHADEARGISTDAFALSLAEGADAHAVELDEIITRHSLKWSKQQISRVALSIMRLAVYEIQYEPDIPISVSINEAVELAKKYGGEEEAAFINGVLGGVARQTDVVKNEDTAQEEPEAAAAEPSATEAPADEATV